MKLPQHIATTVAELDTEIGIHHSAVHQLILTKTTLLELHGDPAVENPESTKPPVEKPRRKGFPPLDLKPKRKSARAAAAEKPKRKYTRRVPAATLTTLSGPDLKPKPGSPVAGTQSPPATFAGACKRVTLEAHHQGKTLTVAETFTAIETRWPDLVADKDGNNVMLNLGYWAIQGKCEKVGRGALASFKILVPEYFQETES